MIFPGEKRRLVEWHLCHRLQVRGLRGQAPVHGGKNAENQRDYETRTLKNRRGRPSRREASAKAGASLMIDPASIDPREILAGIAADQSAPATSRAAACKALLALKSSSDRDEAA